MTGRVNTGGQALDTALERPIADCLSARPILVFGGGAHNQAVLQRMARYTGGGVTAVREPAMAEYYSVFADDRNTPGLSAQLTEVDRALTLADPAGDACLYLGSSTSLSTLAGRLVIGARDPEWELAEHKDRQLEVTRAVVQQPRTVHEAMSEADARTFLRRLRAGEPTMVQGVTAGLPATSSAGNAVVTADLQDAALLRLAGRLAGMTRTITAPLVAGRGVTFYGFCDGMSVMYLPPVEGLALFSPASGEMRAPGALTGTISVELESACRGGLELASRYVLAVGYVGGFGVDGVLTAHGLEVHDINTRICAGHRIYSEAIGVPMMLVDLALRCGAGAAVFDNLREALPSAAAIAAVALWEDRSAEEQLRAKHSYAGAEKLRAAVVSRMSWSEDVRLLAKAGLGVPG